MWNCSHENYTETKSFWHGEFAIVCKCFGCGLMWYEEDVEYKQQSLEFRLKPLEQTINKLNNDN